MENSVFFTMSSPKFRKMAIALENSVKKFYSDIPFVSLKFDEDKIISADIQVKTFLELLEKYKRVIHLNADCLMCNYSPRLFEDYELALPQNNCQYGFNGNDSVKSYMNIGTIGITNPKVVLEWQRAMNTMPVQGCHDQNMLNLVFYSNKFKSLVLDTEFESYGIKDMPSYHDLYVSDNQLMVGVKKVALLHFAGTLWKKDMGTDWQPSYYQIKDVEAIEKIKELENE